MTTPAPPKQSKQKGPAGPNLFGLLTPYKGLITLLVFLTVLGNGLNLAVPKIIASAIDAFGRGDLALQTTMIEFTVVASLVFVLTYGQGIVQTYAAERVARDLRVKLAAKISTLEYASVQKTTPAKLLTNLTADIDAIKNFVAQAIASIISSVFLIVGAGILLFMIDWQLASVVMLIVPIVAGTFIVIFGKVRVLFKRAQEAIDKLNKVINESILGAALIRLLNSQQSEQDKFVVANSEARNVSLGILRLFASMIPIVTFATNAATMTILLLGGHYVIVGNMSLGDFTAFNSYLAILIFPIFVLGFSSNLIAQATASYARVLEVMGHKDKPQTGLTEALAHGDLALNDVSVAYGEKNVLKDVSLVAKAGTRTAIIGPTAAGKTQLLYLLTGLLAPTKGSIEYAGKDILSYDPVSLHKRIGFVFQDSVLFNLTLRENIAFSDTVKDADIEKAIATAELGDFIATLPQGLDTIVSERGTSLSGGQKQRIMLARALALDPSVLLLDDFTARVDANTESRILANVHKNYPDITIISVTQKISSIEDYDQIVLLMEGELLAKGTHAELLETSPEYVQVYNSQRSTSSYELHAE